MTIYELAERFGKCADEGSHGTMWITDSAPGCDRADEFESAAAELGYHRISGPFGDYWAER